MRPSAPNPLAVLDAAYDHTLDAQTWLGRVVDSARPFIDSGEGVLAALLDVAHMQAGGKPRVEAMHAVEASDAATGTLGEVVTLTFRPEVQRRFMRAASVTSVRRVLGRAFAEAGVGEVFRRNGLADGRFVTAGDLNQAFVVLGSVSRAQLGWDRRTKIRLERMAAHVASALRLLRSDARQVDEAIFDADGRVAHLEGAAKADPKPLHQAVVRLRRARGRRRDDPDAALAWWQALVEGRWSLVERVDSDGKRFVVARVNDAPGAARPALTLRERQIVAQALRGHSNKLIAYELGIDVGSVASHLARAFAKLGVASRTELFAAFPAGAPREVDA